MPELDTEFDQRAYFHKRRMQEKRAAAAKPFNSKTSATATAKARLTADRNAAAQRLKQIETARKDAEQRLKRIQDAEENIKKEISRFDDAIDALDQKPSGKQPQAQNPPKR
ncbi:MAG: hypothetical protein ACQEQL_00645 [Pseudomonadota bacterium]